MHRAGKYFIVGGLVVAVGLVMATRPGRDKTAAALPGREAVATAPTGLPRLVDLGAGKCIPCKMMAPILADLKLSLTGKLDVVFIDVWEHPDEAQKRGINLIPTQIFYDATGQERFRHEGFFAKEEILAKWRELGVDLK